MKLKNNKTCDHIPYSPWKFISDTTGLKHSQIINMPNYKEAFLINFIKSATRKLVFVKQAIRYCLQPDIYNFIRNLHSYLNR